MIDRPATFQHLLKILAQYEPQIKALLCEISKDLYGFELPSERQTFERHSTTVEYPLHGDILNE